MFNVVYYTFHFVQFDKDLHKKYVETASTSRKILRTGLPKSFYKKLYKIEYGTQLRKIDFATANRQFY